jgi:ketosteroid isomerase-like protein
MSSASTTLTDSELAAETRELADKILKLMGDEEQFDYYADDVVIEFPYGPSLGMPDRFESKPVVVAYVRQLNEQLPGLKMDNPRFYSVADDPNTVFIEYTADIPTPGGNTYSQIYINKMRFRDGKMVSMREFWDPKRIIDALDGTYDGNLR